MSTPSTLFHGSAYKQTELMPGYLRSKVLVQWDEVESNEWLYATTDKTAAILLGLASAVEKGYLLNRFEDDDKGHLTFTVQGTTLTYDKLIQIGVYVYSISHREDDDWVKNENKNNSITTEWKTKSVIPGKAFKIEKVDIRKFLKDYRVTIRYVDPHGKEIRPTLNGLSW